MRRITALRALELGQLGAPAGRLGRPPVGPSCSRWLSCSCCRQKSQKTKTPTPFRVSQTTSSPAIPALSTLQRMQTPHLPLPPPLPWSPDSAPFLRHMQILSLALLSPSPDESWEIYEGLHPDLRELIPDDVFISLLAHQLGDKKRFARVLELLRIGQRCDMNPRAFSQKTMEGIVSSLLGRLQPGSWDDKSATVLEWLWPTCMELNNNSFAGFPFDVRKRWLAYMAIAHKDDCETVFGALEDVVEQGGANGMAPSCSLVVGMYRGSDPYLHRTSLRLATWCLARDIEIREETLRTILVRLGASLEKGGESGTKGVYDAVHSLIAELTAGEAHDPAQQLRVVLDWYLASQRTASQKAQDLAHDPTATMPKVHRAAERLLKREELDDSDLAAVVSLCLRAFKFSDADYETLLRITTKRLSQRGTSPAHIVRLADGIVSSGILTRDILSPQLVSRLFNALTDAIGQDDAAYPLAFRFYPVARASIAEGAKHIWQKTSTQRWLALFHRATTVGHFHFASRLYADFQADGQTVPPSAQLMFIRKIASTQSDSRQVLLDRHIKDYLWDADAPKEPLVRELCLGLSRSPNDAALALTLCSRIQPKVPPPPVAIASLVVPLLSSAREGYQRQGLALLSKLPEGEVSRPAFHAALAALCQTSVTAETLVKVHRLMVNCGLAPTAETASLVIAGFLKAGDLQVAKALFDAAAERQHAVHPGTLWSLMVKLAESGRTDEAYAVEAAWRALSSDAGDSDASLVGARLYVDIMAGRDVHLGAYVSAGRLVAHGGWKPTRALFRWLEKAQWERAGGEGGKLVSLLAQREVAEVAEVADEAPEQPAGRQPVQPVTQSFVDGKRWVSRDIRGVDMGARGARGGLAVSF